jgi:hypothetical protein
VTLEAGSYGVEWFSLREREASLADDVTVQGPGAIGFTAPTGAGLAVLHLTKIED